MPIPIPDWEIPLDLNASDEELGRTILSLRLAAEASIQGIPPDQILPELAEKWIERIAYQEANDEDVPNIAVEKAHRLAAKGEWARAGRMSG